MFYIAVHSALHHRRLHHFKLNLTADAFAYALATTPKRLWRRRQTATLAPRMQTVTSDNWLQTSLQPATSFSLTMARHGMFEFDGHIICPFSIGTCNLLHIFIYLLTSPVFRSPNR